MKKSKNILILCLIIAILLSFYLFLKSKPQEITEQAELADERITLIDIDNEKISRIVLKSQSNTLKFVKKEQQWTANLPFPIKESEVTSLSYVFFGLNAEQLIMQSPAPEDLDQYGLLDPAVTIEVSAEGERTSYVMYLGDRTPSGASYYFKLEDDPAVYTIAYYNAEKFLQAPEGFRDNSLAQIDIKKINYFKLTRTGKPDLEIHLNTGPSEYAQYGIGIWQMTKPYQEPMPVLTEQFQKILESITSITNAEKFIDDSPVDLNRYGLKKPQAELLIKDKDSQFRLLIGDAINDAFYCKKSDSKPVFTISSNSLFFIDTKPFELVEKFAYIVNIDNVDKIEISGLGASQIMKINRKPKKSDVDEDSQEFDISYQINGKLVEEQLFKTAYQFIIGLTVESECPDKPKNNPAELSMTFYLNKGAQREIQINYVPYDYDFYAVFRGGKAEFLISKDQVKTMLRKLKATIDGK